MYNLSVLPPKQHPVIVSRQISIANVSPNLTDAHVGYCIDNYNAYGDIYSVVCTTRRGPCQHGFMCGCEQWSNTISESNYNMQPITIKFAVRVGPT